MSRPSPKARPWSCGTTVLTIADPAASHKHFELCPWGCVALGLHRALVDREGVPRATWCELCDRTFTVIDWSMPPTPRRP